MKKVNYFIAIVFISIPLFFSSCIFDDIGIRGEGEVVARLLDIEDVTGVKVNGSFDVVIQQGSEQLIEAVGHENIIDRLDTDIKNGTVELELIHGFYHDFELTIYVTVPTIEYINLNGSGDVELYAFTGLDDLEIKLNGSGDIREKGPVLINGKLELKVNGSGDAALDVSCEEFEFRQAGSGDLKIAGSTVKQDIRINGSGNVRAFNFESEDCDVRIYGSGNAQLRVKGSLDASIYGSGDVAYKDYPVINFNSAGSGTLRNAN